MINDTKQTPTVYSIKTLKEWDCDLLCDGEWVPARPMGLQGLFLRKRITIAWKVFKGEYDAVKW